MAIAPAFRIETAEQGMQRSISVTGELDHCTCERLLDAFQQAIGGSAVSALVLDLRGLSFIDSAGLRTITGLELAARDADATLTVVPAPPAVMELLQLTGVGDRLTFEPRSGEAAPVPGFIERLIVEMPRDRAAPAHARNELRQVIAGRLSDPETATGLLLTSELVTNAVLHPKEDAAGPIELRITSFEDRVRVEVTDPGPGFDPAGIATVAEGTSGRGLLLVKALSTRWGIALPAASAKQRFSVWFELQLQGAANPVSLQR